MSRENHVLASATKSASYNMILQLAFRILTFVLNAFTLRYVSKDLLGVVNVRLMLLYSTIAFVAREAFRRACLSKSSNRNWQQVINLLWCTLPISVVWAVLFSMVWLYVLTVPDPSVVPHYTTGVLCYASAIVLEMTTEALYVVSQAMLFVKLKVVIEGVSVLGRCLVTVILIMTHPSWGVIAFSIAQLTYTLIYVLCYYGYFVWYTTSQVKKDDDFPFHSFRDFFPRLLKNQPLMCSQLTELTWSFFKQSFLKQVLTEGERYVMTMFSLLSFADQGVYDVIVNLGSLAARFIFLPIEDSSYLFFSQMIERDKPFRLQHKESISLASRVLRALLRIVSTIGVTILVFGYAYSYLLLDIYGGSILSSGTGPTLLRWYSVYVLFIAVNGTTECFMFAAMSKKMVDSYNHKMLIFSVIFLLSSWQLTTTFGSVGFIWANCLNMLARITFSVFFIKEYYKGTPYWPITGLYLPGPVIMAYIGSLCLTACSEVMFCCTQGILMNMIHIAIGGVSILIVSLAIIISERELVDFIRTQYYTRPKVQ